MTATSEIVTVVSHPTDATESRPPTVHRPYNRLSRAPPPPVTVRPEPAPPPTEPTRGDGHKCRARPVHLLPARPPRVPTRGTVVSRPDLAPVRLEVRPERDTVTVDKNTPTPVGASPGRRSRSTPADHSSGSGPRRNRVEPDTSLSPYRPSQATATLCPPSLSTLVRGIHRSSDVVLDSTLIRAVRVDDLNTEGTSYTPV